MKAGRTIRRFADIEARHGDKGRGIRSRRQHEEPSEVALELVPWDIRLIFHPVMLASHIGSSSCPGYSTSQFCSLLMA